MAQKEYSPLSPILAKSFLPSIRANNLNNHSHGKKTKTFLDEVAANATPNYIGSHKRKIILRHLLYGGDTLDDRCSILPQENKYLESEPGSPKLQLSMMSIDKEYTLRRLFKFRPTKKITSIDNSKEETKLTPIKLRNNVAEFFALQQDNSITPFNLSIAQVRRPEFESYRNAGVTKRRNLAVRLSM